MEFTKEVVIDCYQQAKVKQPQTQEEIDYNKLLDRKIKEENGETIHIRNMEMYKSH